MIPFLTSFRNKLNELVALLEVNRVFYTLLLIVLAIGSFFLGRLSKIFDERPVFSLEEMFNIQEEQKVGLQDFANTATSTIVASRKGKKYYFVWCKYAGTIKESNKIYFDTEEKAKASGRTLASGCQ